MEAYRTEFGRYPTVRAAATATRNLCYANKDQLSAGIICAGWDDREGGSVFSVPQVDDAGPGGEGGTHFFIALSHLAIGHAIPF